MRRQVLKALVLMLFGTQAFASDVVRASDVASDCQSQCKVKFENCKSDCYNNPDDAVVHKEECTRTCDQNFNFVCVRHCN